MISKKNLTQVLPILGLGLALILFAYWGGVPVQGGLFAAGIAVQLLIIAMTGAVGWYLLFSPLPDATTVQPKTSRRLKQIVGGLIGLCGLNFVVSGIWDALWHIQYGIPFGKDFFWRPHLLMYSSFLLIAGFAFGGAVFVVKEGQGDIRRGFRQHPLLGVLALVSGFMLIVVGFDPVWHMIYGPDISAWSLPHLLLVGGFDAVMIAAAMIQASINYEPSLRRLQLRDSLVILPLAFAGYMGLLLGTVEWREIRAIPITSLPAFWQRPEWLYPVVCITLALFFATLALRLTKAVGAATLLGGLVLGIQTVVQFTVGGLTPFSAGALCLLTAMGVDLTSLIYWRRKQTLAPWYSLAAVCTALLATGGMLIIAQTMVYPRVNISTVPMMVVMSLLIAAGVAWLAEVLANQVDGMLRPRELPEQSTSLTPRLTVSFGLALAAAMTIFIVTAVPPK
jgi:hypothetical protein